MYKYLDRIRLRIIHKSARRSSFLSLFFQRRCLFLKHRQVMSSMWFSTKKASSNAAVLKCGCLQTSGRLLSSTVAVLNAFARAVLTLH
jgi:hypothetical protein